MKPNNVHRGVLFSLGGALWAAAYLMPYKAATQQIPADVLTLAMLFSAAVLNIIPAWLGSHKFRGSINHLSVGVSFVLGVLSVIGNYAMAKTLLFLSPGIASVLLRSQVLFVGLLGWIWLGERITSRFVMGALLALTGLVLLKIRPSEGFVLATEGLLWVMLAAICFAIMQVVTRNVIHCIDPVLVNALRLWTAVILLFVLSLHSGSITNLGGKSWLLAGLAALFGPFFSRICYMWSLQHIPAVLSTLVAMSSPVFAFLLGIIFFQTWPNPAEVIGGSVMLIGISIPVIEMTSSLRNKSQ